MLVYFLVGGRYRKDAGGPRALLANDGTEQTLLKRMNFFASIDHLTHVVSPS